MDHRPVHILRGQPLCDLREETVFTAHARAGTCDGVLACELRDPAWRGHRASWYLISCGIRMTVYIYISSEITVLASSEHTG